MGLSLQELEDLENKQPPADPAATAAADKIIADKKIADDNVAKGLNPDGTAKTEIKGGTGDKAPDNLEEAQRLQREDAARKLAEDNVAKGLNADGSPKDAGTEADEGDEEVMIFEDVDKIWGAPLEVEYGDLDPLTAEGIHLREKAVADRAVNNFEKFLQKEDPRGYQYLLHRRTGGTDEDFFNRKTTTLPEYEAFKESVDLQVRVYRDNLIAKGVDADDAKLFADQAVKEKKIFEKADKAYKQVETEQTNAITATQKELADLDKERSEAVQNLTKAITEGLTSPNLKIVVPDTKRAEFQKYFSSLIRLDDETGQFMIAQAVTPEKLLRLMEGAYLQFAGGNLDAVVRRQAGTDVAKRRLAAVRKTAEPSKSQPDNRPTRKTLGEI